MASCEKCWSDARRTGVRYSDLIRDRETAGIICTPEQQAGEDAKPCAMCGRKTMHQYCGVCMACGWSSEISGHQEQP